MVVEAEAAVILRLAGADVASGSLCDKGGGEPLTCLLLQQVW